MPVAILIAGAGIVYAAQSYRLNNGQTQQINEQGACAQIGNGSGKDIFVPTNSSTEWSAFRDHVPSGVTISSCCAGNSGSACSATSAANSCGQTATNYGTIQCNGSCSVSAPAVPGNPANYGNACTSAANACGQTNSGTIQCNGTCSASTPGNPANYGNACTSSANACGQTNSGTIQCDGSCSASAPSDSNCPYTWKQTSYTHTVGATGCHYEQECSDTIGFADAYRDGESCSTPGSTVTCYVYDSGSGCSGNRVQGYFRDKYVYQCSQ